MGYLLILLIEKSRFSPRVPDRVLLIV